MFVRQLHLPYVQLHVITTVSCKPILAADTPIGRCINNLHRSSKFVWYMIQPHCEHVYSPRQKDRQRQIIYSWVKHIVNSNYTVAWFSEACQTRLIALLFDKVTLNITAFYWYRYTKYRDRITFDIDVIAALGRQSGWVSNERAMRPVIIFSVLITEKRF